MSTIRCVAEDAGAATDSLVVRYRVPQPAVHPPVAASGTSSTRQAPAAPAPLDGEEVEPADDSSATGEVAAQSPTQHSGPAADASAEQAADQQGVGSSAGEAPVADTFHGALGQEGVPADEEGEVRAGGGAGDADGNVTTASVACDVDAPEAPQEMEAEVELSAEQAPVQPYLEISTNCGADDGVAPAAYIVRRHAGAVPADNPADSIDVGVLAQQGGLQGIGALLEHVYIPLLVADMPGGDADGTAVGASGAQHAVDADLLAAMQKFLGQVKLGSAHLTGNVKLSMPDFEVGGAHERDEELLQALEHVLHDWTLTLQKLKQAQASKTAGQDGPLDEIDYWSERNNVLGGVHEQLQQPRLQQIIQCAPFLLVCCASRCVTQGAERPRRAGMSRRTRRIKACCRRSERRRRSWHTRALRRATTSSSSPPSSATSRR